MSEKIIRKDQLDALIELQRELNDTPYDEANVDRIIKEGIKVARAIEEDTGLTWNATYDFVWSVIRGLNPDATNEELYKGLELFGWEVQDEA